MEDDYDEGFYDGKNDARTRIMELEDIIDEQLLISEKYQKFYDGSKVMIEILENRIRNLVHSNEKRECEILILKNKNEATKYEQS